METAIDPTPTYYQSNSLIEFLLGDGIHAGWLDEQSHHSFLSSALFSKEARVRINSSSGWRLWFGGRSYY